MAGENTYNYIKPCYATCCVNYNLPYFLPIRRKIVKTFDVKLEINPLSGYFHKLTYEEENAATQHKYLTKTRFKIIKSNNPVKEMVLYCEIFKCSRVILFRPIYIDDKAFENFVPLDEYTFHERGEEKKLLICAESIAHIDDERYKWCVDHMIQ